MKYEASPRLDALLLPGHATLEELLATEVVAGEPVSLHQTLLDDRLGRDTGVVVAGDEESRESLHAVPVSAPMLACSRRDGGFSGY